jgi:hypothetical protein
MARAEALQRGLASTDVSDPLLYQNDVWRPVFARLRREILQRDLRFEIMGPPQRLYSNFIRGIRSLPVRIVN